jgi:hypothetical protein
MAQASLAQICASQSDCQQFKPRHPAFDEARGLITLAQRMCREPETVFAEHASKYLRADKIGYLNQKFPRKNFESIKELALAVLEEIKSALLPSTPGFAALDPATLDPATEAFCTEIIKSNRRFSQQLLSAAHGIAHHQK